MYFLSFLSLLLPFPLAFANPLPQLQFATEGNETLSSRVPSCWPPRPLPPGFRSQCSTALEDLMATVPAFQDIVFASFPDRTRHGHWIKVPYMRTLGNCEFKIYLSKNGPPYYYGTTRNAFAFTTNQIVTKCMADERHSGGGFLWIEIEAEPPKIPERNAMLVEFFPAGAELPVYASGQAELASATTTSAAAAVAVGPTFSASVAPLAVE